MPGTESVVGLVSVGELVSLVWLVSVTETAPVAEPVSVAEPVPVAEPVSRPFELPSDVPGSSLPQDMSNNPRSQRKFDECIWTLVRR